MGFRSPLLPLSLCALLTAAATVSQAQAVALVSKAAFPQQGAGGLGPLPPGAHVMSDDGRYLVFESDAPNLVAGQVDRNGEPDVFLYDRVGDTLTLVSHVPGNATTAGELASFGARLSADGAWVAFVSFAGDLVAGLDANLGGSDIYLFSRASGTVTLVSHAGAATTTGNGASQAAEISADGAFVAFTSEATDLVAGSDTNAGPDVFLFESAGGAVTLVSHAAGAATTAANDASLAPQVSSTGRYVAFASGATNLVAGASDGNNRSDVFLADRLGTIALVSHAAGTPLVAADDGSQAPTLSADGSFVAFESDAENLVAGQADPNGKSDVFLYERAGGTSALVSRSSTAATTAGNERSRVALVSSDGNWVAFESRASDLLAGGADTNLLEDVFLFSRTGGTVSLASHRPALPTTAGNAASFVAGLSADGGRVALHSAASDLTVAADTNQNEDVFLFDRVGGAVALVSHALSGSGTVANGFSSQALPSPDGSLVAFLSAASDLIAPTGALGRELYLHQAASGANALVSKAAATSVTAAGLPLVEPPHRRTVSADGRFVAFTSDAPNLVPGQVDPNGEPDVFLYDAQNDTVTLVSHATGAPARAGNANSYRPSLSADGAWVAFASNATDLLATSQLECQVYLWERATGNLTLVSHAPGGQSGNGCSDGPALSADGAWLAFYSLATDLVAGQVDGNEADDAFLYQRGTGGLSLVSHAVGQPATAGNGGTPLVFGRGHDAPAVSADGAYLAFPSLATNLVAGGSDTNGGTDVFLYDRVAGSLTLVSHAAGAAAVAANGAADAPLVSTDGGQVVYSSLATNAVAGQSDANGGADVFVYSRSTGLSTLVSRAAAAPATTANAPSADHALDAAGQWLAFSSPATNVVAGVTDANTAADVFLFDASSGQASLVSHTAGSPATTANGASRLPVLSADGAALALVSSASDLAAGQTDTNGVDDVFRYDRVHDTSSLVSHVPAPVTTSGNSVSAEPALSADGSHVAFGSASSDLVAGDLAGPVDVFYSALPPVPVELQSLAIE